MKIDDILTPRAVKNKNSGYRKAVFSSASRKQLLFVLIVIAFCITAAILWFFIQSQNQDSIKNAESGSIKEKYIEQDLFLYVDIGNIVVMLADHPQGKKEYLRMRFSIKLDSAKDVTFVTQRAPLIKDTIISFVSSLRSIDFNGSSNMVYIKQEILKRVQSLIHPVIVQEILFQEMIVN